jgi:arylsulfatase A-like enzyme
MLDWIAGREEGPFFVMVNYFDAHAPYLPPEPFNTAFDPKRPLFSKVFIEGMGAWDGTPAETQREVTAYDEAIKYVDYEIGELLGEMRQQGLLENTLIIITSDHGEEFREHEVMSHGNSLYRQSVQVPLIMVFPNHLPAGARVEDPISLRNIPATVMDLVGLNDAYTFPGNSLTSYLENLSGNTSAQEDILLNEVSHISSRPSYYPISKGDMKSFVFDGMRYILNSDGSEELYDFNDDPEEMNDLSDTPEGRAALPQYRLLLESILSRSDEK